MKSRTQFLNVLQLKYWLLVTALTALCAPPAFAQTAHQAMGVKVGEVTDTSAIVWARLTTDTKRNDQGQVVKGHIGGKAAPQPLPADIGKLEGACPGAPGQARVRYATREDLTDAQATDWVEVTATADFQHQFRLTGLKPATVYFYSTESTGPGGVPKHGALGGRFETAPAARAVANVTFCVVTCQAYTDLDHKDGFNIYPAMAKLNPQFVTFTGDNVYYDSEEPRAQTIELARYHWQRMYSLPRHIELLRHVATYWEKDDHDTWDNDSWPSMTTKRMGELTFTQGQQIFREQVPMGEKTYRTVRWGKDLQIWLTEGRDFRSPNNMKDGPDKTIWGHEQKEWLKQSLLASDATWKVLISPTPIVGPDRGNKNDNLSDTGFNHEGDEIRQWFQANVPDNFFVVCGDRHWQYHSVHPQTGLHEFSVGAASDEHAGGSPGFDPEYHKFHLVKGGFLSVATTRRGNQSAILFQHHDVHGKVMHEFKKEGRKE